MSKITPGSNQMWEGSRFMLPEHVAMINQRNKEKLKKKKPEFDEQYLNELAMKIAEAKQEEYIVSVSIFDEYDETKMVGKITALDTQLRRLKIEDEHGPFWADFDDILDIEKI